MHIQSLMDFFFFFNFLILTLLCSLPAFTGLTEKTKPSAPKVPVSCKKWWVRDSTSIRSTLHSADELFEVTVG